MVKELKFLQHNRQIDKKHVEKLCVSIKKNGYIEGLPITVKTTILLMGNIDI